MNDGQKVDHTNQRSTSDVSCEQKRIKKKYVSHVKPRQATSLKILRVCFCIGVDVKYVDDVCRV